MPLHSSRKEASISRRCHVVLLLAKDECDEEKSVHDSRYDHPNEETLQRLASRSLPTYWTATYGDIVLLNNGNEVQVKTQRDAPTDPLSLREGDPLQPGTTADIASVRTFAEMSARRSLRSLKPRGPESRST
jgi:hypothetical protein